MELADSTFVFRPDMFKVRDLKATAPPDEANYNEKEHSAQLNADDQLMRGLHSDETPPIAEYFRLT